MAIPVTFEPCEMRKCINVTITDDLTVEEKGESFFVRLGRDSTINFTITLDPVLTRVTIKDNDGMYN